MITQPVTSNTMFIEAFRNADRMDNFSINGLKALYEFLDNLSDDTDEDVTMDVIALCCEFSEMDWDEVIDQYGSLVDDEEWAECEDMEDKINTMLSMLNDETMVVYYDDEKVLFRVF